ncbi:MAG: hypothetical protein R8M45_09470 [Ghiorsea sp.]
MALPIVANGAAWDGGNAVQRSGNVVPNQLWSRKLIAAFYNQTVFGAIASTDYEGEIKAHGDLVTIRTTPDIVISNYVKGQSLAYENPIVPTVDLIIDQGKYFALQCDDVDKFQSDYDFVKDWTSAAAENMKVTVDTDVLAYVATAISVLNQGATAGVKSAGFNLGTALAPVVLTPLNVIDLIVDMGTVLDESNVPETGRWLVLPAWVVGMIKKSAITNATLQGGDQSLYRNGRVGMVDRFEIFSSNSIVPSGLNYDVIAGHKTGLTFASQLTKSDTIPNPNSFGSLVRGLQVYGRQVVKSDALALAVVSR